MKCSCCGGPFHPATGDYDRRFDMARCGRCYREFLAWFKGHTRRKWGKLNFYEHAATSIRPA